MYGAKQITDDIMLQCKWQISGFVLRC